MINVIVSFSLVNHLSVSMYTVCGASSSDFTSLRNSASSIHFIALHWLRSSIFPSLLSFAVLCCLLCVRPASVTYPLIGVLDHTNHTASVKIWYWQCVIILWQHLGHIVNHCIDSNPRCYMHLWCRFSVNSCMYFFSCLWENLTNQVVPQYSNLLSCFVMNGVQSLGGLENHLYWIDGGFVYLFKSWEARGIWMASHE